MENKEIAKVDLLSTTRINKIPSSNNLEIIDSARKNANKKLESLVLNYKKIVEINIKILQDLIDNYKLKPVILYHFGFVLELSIKMILLKYNISNIEETTALGHKITELFKKIENNSNDNKIKTIFEDIQSQKNLIHNDKGKIIDYDNYADYKYNNKKTI